MWTEQVSAAMAGGGGNSDGGQYGSRSRRWGETPTHLVVASQSGLQPLPLTLLDGLQPRWEQDEQVMLDKGLLGPQRDGPFFVRGREGIAGEEKGHLVRGDEVRDVGEDAGEGEVVCRPGENSTSGSSSGFCASFAGTDGSGNLLLQ